MAEIRDRRHIAAPPREVWKVVSDVDRYAEWGPWTRMVRRLDVPAGLGAAYDERSRLLAPVVVSSRWRVVEFEPPRRQVHRAEAAPWTAAFERVFELASDGLDGTWLTLALHYRPALGPAGRLADRAALRRLLTRRLPRILEGIEQLAVTPGRVAGL